MFQRILERPRRLTEGWNRLSPWTQFRHIQRIALGSLLIIVGVILFGAETERGTLHEMAITFPAFDVNAFARTSFLLGIVVIVWRRATFWALVFLGMPVHLYLAFTWQGAFKGAIGWQSAVFYSFIEAGVFVGYWIAIRNERMTNCGYLRKVIQEQARTILNLRLQLESERRRR